jgi:WD40 repeat protein
VAGFEDDKPRAENSEDYKPVKIEFWNLAKLERRETFTGPQGLIYSLAFSPDGRTLASGGFGNVMLWDTTRWSASTGRSAPKPH